MRPRKNLRKYQDAGVEFVKRVKRGALFVDPGLGKSAITLTAFTDLIDDVECGRVLVIAPPRVARKTWPDEFGEWEHTHEHSYVHVGGSVTQRRKLMKRKVSFHIMSIELMLLAVNINFVAFSSYLGDLVGQVFTLFVLTVAAAEAAIGLAILVVFFRNRGTIDVEDVNVMKG